MKRSLCLSAMLVGLSVTASSVAFAAPTAPESAGSGTKRVLVAQAKRRAPKRVQTTDPAPGAGGTAPATTPAAPTDPAAPAEPAEPAAPVQPPPEVAPAGPAVAPAPATAPAATPAPASTPAITIGTGTNTVPGADTPAAPAEGAKKKPKTRPFAGTQIFVQTSMSTATVFQGQQQYSNPTVDTAAYLLPRYTLSDTFQLRGRMLFFYEFTNSDSTQTRNEPRFSDATLQLFYKKIPAFLGIKPQLSANLGIPTSSESRARTMVVAPGAGLQLAKPVEHLLGGDFLFLVATAYSHPIYRSNTAEIRGSAPYAFSCAGGNNCSDQLTGVFNPSDTLSYTALVAGEWGKFSPALFYLGSSQWTYQGKTPTNPVDGTPVESAPGFRPSGVRQASYFSAWLDYNANSWFTAEVGYSLFRAGLDADGQRGNPFFGRYQDMRVYLGANFNIDNIMKELEGGETDGGIVRAKNKKQPFWMF